MIRKGIFALFLAAALCLSLALAEGPDGYTYTDVADAEALQEWMKTIPRSQKVGVRLTADIEAPAFSFADSTQNDCDIAIDLNGKTLTLTEPFVGPSGTDAIYCGFSSQVFISSGAIKTNANTAALIRSKAWKLTLHDVTAGDGTRTYSEGVICAPKGDLDLTGSTSLLQGPGSTLALSVGEENTERGARAARLRQRLRPFRPLWRPPRSGGPSSWPRCRRRLRCLSRRPVRQISKPAPGHCP